MLEDREFEAAVTRYKHIIYATSARFVLKGKVDQEDLVQESMIFLVKEIERWKEEQSTNFLGEDFERYFRVALAHRITDIVRTWKPPRQAARPYPSTEERAFYEKVRRSIVDVDFLYTPYISVILLAVWDGKPYAAEIDFVVDPKFTTTAIRWVTEDRPPAKSEIIVQGLHRPVIHYVPAIGIRDIRREVRETVVNDDGDESSLWDRLSSKSRNPDEELTFQEDIKRMERLVEKAHKQLGATAAAVLRELIHPSPPLQEMHERTPYTKDGLPRWTVLSAALKLREVDMNEIRARLRTFLRAAGLRPRPRKRL